MPPQEYQPEPETPAESPGRPAGLLARLVRAAWIDRESAGEAFDRQHRRDRVGLRLHLLFACGAMLALSTTNTAAEIGFAPLAVYSIVRLANTWRSFASLFAQPATVCCLGYAAWAGASLLWSPDVSQGLDELAMVRVLAIGLMLWPILEARRWLIAALAVGFACGNLVQLAYALADALGIDWTTWDRWEGRNSIWWDPVVGGTLLTAALGLHLPAAFMGRGRTRGLALGGAGLAAFGVLATGSRGAWLASAALIAIVACVALVRTLRGTRPRARSLVLPLVGALLVGGAGWLLAGDLVATRVDRAREEITLALREGDYETDTGARLLMAGWALRAVRDNPVAGVGLGGYRAWTLRRIEAIGRDPDEPPIHDHAHNTYLHAAATTGLVGLVLVLGALAFAIVGGFTAGGLGRRRPVDFGSYDAGPAFALLGLALAGMFDVVHLSAQSAALLVVILTLCPSIRPVERGGRPGPGSV